MLFRSNDTATTEIYTVTNTLSLHDALPIYMQAALERGWPLAILVQIQEKTQNEIQHCADQGTPSIRRETNYIEQDESEETENQNMGPQGLADEGERIHSIVDEMEAEDQTAIEMEEYEDSSDDEQYSLPKEWKEHGFGLVDRVDEAGPINPHPRAAGPSKTWFLQFTVRIHSKYKFNCYNSHVPLIVETINLNCLCILPFWLRMPTSTV